MPAVRICKLFAVLGLDHSELMLTLRGSGGTIKLGDGLPMPAWVSLLTAASLALHLALGCGWHHAHAADTICTACEADHHDEDAEHAHTDHEQHSVPVKPARHNDCEADSCVYITAGKVTATSLAFAGLIEARASDACLGNPTLVSRGLAPPRVVAAVRPHLLYQVFLI